jgi:hypothetical protein
MDSYIDQWRESLEQNLAAANPRQQADILLQQDQATDANFRDVDPNTDVLRKNPENLGPWLKNIQRNLKSHGMDQAPKDIREWMERMVDDPAFRPQVARAALQEARRVFDQAARGLDAALQQNIEPAEAMTAQARDAALGKLRDDAHSTVLRLIWSAYSETISQDRQAALNACTARQRARLDTAAARYTARFFHEMPALLDRLIEELDSYSVKLTRALKTLKDKEKDTISSRVLINGERLWNPDTDVDEFYGRYATADQKSHVGASTVRDLVDNGRLYGLRQLGDEALRRALVDRASSVFGAIKDDVDVIARFLQKHQDQPARRQAIRHVYELSRPFIELDAAFEAGGRDYVASPGKRQTIIGVHNGGQPVTPEEKVFRGLMDDLERLESGRYAMLPNQYEILFLRESAAFPLRLLKEMSAYRQDYEYYTAGAAAQNPIHVRKDVSRWEPIDVPTSGEQDVAWETFIVGWASGVIVASTDREARTIFTTSYRDPFGMPVDRTVGYLLSLGQAPARKADSDAQSNAASILPPLEVHNIILTLCSDRSLLDGVRRGIDTRIRNLGANPFAAVLVQHAEEQKKRELSVYDDYRTRLLQYFEDHHMQPPAAGEGQAARIDIRPSDANLQPGASVNLIATVYDSFGHILVDAPLTWSARPPELGMIDASGCFRAFHDGEVSVTAMVAGAGGGIAQTARVRISASQPEAPTVAPVVTAPAAPAQEACVCGEPVQPGFAMCPSCGKPFRCKNGHTVKPAWKICPFCGDDLAPTGGQAPAPSACPKCGTAIQPGFKVCPECGQTL